jgi:hypothetical protein
MEPSSEAVEAAAVALYESQRDDEHRDPDYDWPRIDTAYDKPDEDEDDPEWLRNQYRADARAALSAALPIIRREERAKVAEEIEDLRRPANGFGAGLEAAIAIARGES